MRMPLVVVDTREQQPFPLEGLRVIRRKLDFGDYSLMGHQRRVAVERKSLEDLFGTLSGARNRERFEAELMRASAADARLYIAVEADPAEVAAGTRFTQVPGRAVLERLFKLCSRHGAAPVFGGSRAGAEIATVAILRAHAGGEVEWQRGRA